MEKDELLKTAALLKQPSVEASAEFSKKSDAMVELLNQRFSQRTDIDQLIGVGNTEMMFENHRNHLRFMRSLFNEYNPVAFMETVLWVFRAYRSHGFKLTYWPAQLDNWVEIFKSQLSPACFEEIYPFYHWMIINNPTFANLSDKAILTDSSTIAIKHD
jgi:hypothetical protein